MADGFLMMDLMRAFYWFDNALQKGLKAHGWPDISRMQSMVLANVALGEQRASRLAENLGVTRQAMSQTLLEMQARDLIQLNPDPTDRRAQLACFSDKASALRDDANNILQYVEAMLGSRIGKAKLRVLRDALGGDWGEAPAAPPALRRD